MANEKDVVSEVCKNADISVSLEGWPCAVAVLGICTMFVIVNWINCGKW